MSPTILSATLVMLLYLGLSPAQGADVDHHPCQGIKVPSSPGNPRAGNTVNNDYGGQVTEITKDSITIQWVNSADEKPKKFAVSQTLAEGKTPIERRILPGQLRPGNPVMPEYMYRLSDVKVGDCVAIIYARIDGVDICDHIRIWRRPCGEVPPLPEEAEELRDPREVWKKKHPGKPLPEYMANLRYVPYHEWINGYWAKLAPMPREVK